MRKNVPFSINYDTVRLFGKIASYILFLSASISITTVWLRNFNLISDNLRSEVNAALCLLAILYFLMDILQNYLFHCSEFKRRNDFIDNSLNTKLSEKNSIDYFNNDNLEPGVFKLGVNCFENSFFSKEISHKMIPEMGVKLGLIIILFLILSIFPGQSFVVIFLQMALPLVILKQTFRLLVFNFRVDSVFKEFIKIFSCTDSEKRGHIIIHNVMNYETTLSWAGIQLKQSIFKKFNSELSNEWEGLKKRYNIPI
jgi:hypothetical protein